MTPIPPPQPTPPLRIPDWPLPDYRYVPGLNPHPFRHPDGHCYTDGSAPEHPIWTANQPWQQDRAFLRGLDLFEHRYYWESHELWEGVWHQVPRDSSYSLLLQALIQSGAYCLKIHQGESSAAKRLLERVQMRLNEVIRKEGNHFRSVDLPLLLERLADFGMSGAWPSLHD